MIIDMSYWTRVLRRFLYVILILVGLFLAFKLSIFYMPFLIAFIISLIIEPAIRFLMRKLKLTRKKKLNNYFCYSISNNNRYINMGSSSINFGNFKFITRVKWICRKKHTYYFKILLANLI